MRVSKDNSTKPERIVYEVLKELHIPFRHRWLINGREVDFIFGNVALEIDGHDQDGEKNRILAEAGYIPIHLHNSEITHEKVKQIIHNVYD